MDADVIVVGAGPAGSTAACILARRGLDVLLLDRKTFPRDKTCGDGFPPGSIEILNSLGLPASTRYTAYASALRRGGRGRRRSSPNATVRSSTSLPASNSTRSYKGTPWSAGPVFCKPMCEGHWSKAVGSLAFAPQ